MIYGNKFLALQKESVEGFVDAEHSADFLYDYAVALERYMYGKPASEEVLEEGVNSDIKNIVKKAKEDFEENCKAIKKAVDKGDKSGAKAALAKARKSLKDYNNAINQVDENIFSVAAGFFCGIGKGLIMSLFPILGITLAKAQQKGVSYIVGALEILGMLAGGVTAYAKSLILCVSNWIGIFDTIKSEASKKDSNYGKIFNAYRNLSKTEIKIMDSTLDMFDAKIKSM